MKREVVPEILDELEGDDARAIASRRNLRLINALMGNERWILRELEKSPAYPEPRLQSSLGGSGLHPSPHVSFQPCIVELGAGRGELLEKIVRSGFSGQGLDFQPRPDGLSEKAGWAQGNLFETLGEKKPQVVAGSLILHHFQDEELRNLGTLLGRSRKLVFAEPYRSQAALMEGYALFPFVNDVTRHDMMVSIRAGFRKGELARVLGLDEGWHWQEKVTLRGGLRAVATKYRF